MLHIGAACYYKSGHPFILKIRARRYYKLSRLSYYKFGQVITYWESYYKLGQSLLEIWTGITN